MMREGFVRPLRDFWPIKEALKVCLLSEIRQSSRDELHNECWTFEFNLRGIPLFWFQDHYQNLTSETDNETVANSQLACPPMYNIIAVIHANTNTHAAVEI